MGEHCCDDIPPRRPTTLFTKSFHGVDLRPADVRTGQASRPSTRDVALAMDAVTAGLACGEITPSEAERIAGVVETFVRAIETTRRDGSRLNLLEILTAGDCGEDDSEEGGCEETGEYEEPGEETDDYNS